MSAHARPIGLLYPGEMGAALAAALARRGVRVVTTVRERSDETARRAADCGAVVVETLEQLVRQSKMVISLVPPAAAEAVAASYCDVANLAPQQGVFIDMNSISPERATSMAARIAQQGRSFVDGAINGLAANLAASGTMYLSGARAAEVEAIFGDVMLVRVLGDEPGRASAMKMLLGGLSKGVCGLFAELAQVAGRRDLLDEMTQEMARIYPGIRQLIDRMLPTYTEHARRRVTEMRELEQTAKSTGIDPCVIPAICQIHEAIATAEVELPLELLERELKV